MDNQKGQHMNSSVSFELRKLKNLKQQLSVKDINSRVTLELRSLKDLKQHRSLQSKATTHSQKLRTQEVNIHASVRVTSNDSLFDASNHGEPQSKTHKMRPPDIFRTLSEFPDVGDIEVYCYSCESKVYGKYIFKHLFFGPLKCLNCSTRIFKCRTLMNKEHLKTVCKGNGSEPHNFSQWCEKDFLPYMKYHMGKELHIERFCHNLDISKRIASQDIEQAVAVYLNKLCVLSSYHPWKLAITSCQKLLAKCLIQKRELDSNHTASPNETRERVKKIDFSLEKSYIIQGDKRHDFISDENTLTHDQENVRVNSVDEYPRTETKTTKDFNRPNKCLKVSHLNKSSQNEIRGQASNSSISPENSNMIQCGDHYSNSVDSLTNASRIDFANTVDETPHAGTNDQKEWKQYKKHVKVSSNKESEFVRHTVLASDKCLVVDHPSEKCPNKCPKCHCTLCSSRLTFSYSTCVMEIECPNCAFPIYIVPDLKTKLTFRKHFYPKP
ncbi:uncharacterized protein [Panulirus ornatus]|uniref:uncharacterized protein n=1 Tax=Panulirus ornatus TaxID=150431 RepID=UPI003A87C005